MRQAIRHEDTDKDMSALSEMPRFRHVLQAQRAELKDHNMEHKVELLWDLSPEHTKERVFMLVIDDDIEIMLDAEEFDHYTRAI